MRKETIKQLKKKGWSGKDIKKADEIIKARLCNDKSRTVLFSNKVVFWAVIFLMILGNFILSMAIVPFLLVINKLTLDILIIIIGLAFGALFDTVVVDMRTVDRKHQLIAGLVIPIVALINISLMTQAANSLNNLLRFSAIRQDPYTISILYVIAFILPFLWSIFVTKKIEISYKGNIYAAEKPTQKEFLKKY
jgi:hypothetical protein